MLELVPLTAPAQPPALHAARGADLRRSDGFRFAGTGRRAALASLAIAATALAPVRPAAAQAAAQAPRDGRAVLERMQAAYAGTWYHTLTFSQKTTATRRDGTTNVSTWYESLRYTPATGVQLRIDIGEPRAGNGMLYSADSTWIVRGGQLTGTRDSGNEFLPLIEGVYVQPLARTTAEIERMGVDLGRVSAGRWRDRPVWIVGAAAGDTAPPQFWVDQERNVVVRAIIRPNPAGTMDIALDGYERVGPAWLATRIVMAVNGRVVQREEYSDWRTNIELPGALFDVRTWTSAPHWAAK